MKFTTPVEKKDFWAVILLCLVVFAAYIGCLPNSFMFDDHHMVAQNNYLKDARFIPEFFKGNLTSCPIARGMYRPFLMLTFSLNYFLGGLEPYGYHLINIFIHFLNAYFLFVLLKRFFKGLPFSPLLGLVLIFSVHPVNTEAVAYVSSRSILLGSLCVFASLYSYILWKENAGKRYYVFSLGAYASALLIKETGLVLPLLIAAYEFVFTEDLSVKNCKRIFRALIPFAVVTFVYLAVIKLVFGGVFGLFGKPGPQLVSRSLFSNLLTQSAVSFFYLYLFFFPFNLCVDHAFPVISRLADPAGALGVSAVVLALGAALFLRRKMPEASFAILWYFIFLAPQFYARLNLPAAEHHAYPAFFAVYFLCAFTLRRMLSVSCGRGVFSFLNARTGRLFFLFIFCLFSLLTVIRCREWRNEYTLWKSTLRVNPRSGIAMGSIAAHLIKRGYAEEGLRYLEESVAHASLPSTRVTSLLNLVYYNAFLGRAESAGRILEENKQLLLKEHPFGYYKNLALVHTRLGRTEETLEALSRAHRMIPEDEEINGLLGWWYLENSEDTSAAEAFFRSSLKSDPDNVFAHAGLAQTLRKKGLFQEAVRSYTRAVELAPDRYEYYYAVGLIYSMDLKRSEAEWYFNRCIELAPGFAPAYYNLCVFYLSLQEPDFVRAQQYCHKARELGYAVDERIEGLITRRERPAAGTEEDK